LKKKQTTIVKTGEKGWYRQTREREKSLRVAKKQKNKHEITNRSRALNFTGEEGGGRLWKQFNGEIERLAASSPLKLFCTTAFWPIRPVGDQQLKVVKKKTVKKVFLPTTHEFSDHRHRS